MSATILIQGAIPYAGNYQSFRAPFMSAPPEGNYTVPVSVTWATDTVSPYFTIAFNLSDQRNLQISQISALYVDNLSNAGDVIFYFPDTQFRLDVPAYTVGVFPVVTNGLRFSASCASAAGTDMTFVQILNFNPPPVAIEKNVFQSQQGGGGIVALPSNNTPTNTTIITGPGVLHGFQIQLAGALSTATTNLIIELTDGAAGRLLYATNITVPLTTAADVQVVTLSGINVQFVNGITLYLAANTADITRGEADVNLYTS